MTVTEGNQAPRTQRAAWISRWGKRSSASMIAICACVLVSIGELTRLVESLVGRYTNEDHAILWHAASDWQRLRPREPTFYGQPYGVTFEAIPTALLNAVGVPFGTALPTSLVSMALLVWVVFALAAARRDWWLAALAAAASPILLSTDHWVVVGAIGTGVGRLLAAVAAALVLLESQTPITAALAVAIGGFAIAIDSAAVMIAMPALIWGAFSWKGRRFAYAIALGCLAPIAWKVGGAWFDALHPDHALHGGWSLDTNLEALFDNYHNLDRMLGPHALEFYRHGDLYLFAGVLLLGLATFSRDLRAGLTVIAYFGLLVLLAAQTKMRDGTVSLWFPPARMTLAAPAGLWFSGTVTLHAFFERARRLTARSGRMLAPLATILLAALTVGTGAARTLTWQSRRQEIEDVGVSKSAVELFDVNRVYAVCARASRAAQDAGTRIVIFPLHRTFNYACAALDRRLITSTPDYERRYWVLKSLSSKVSERLILWGLKPQDCKRKRYKTNVTSCSSLLNDEAILLEYEPQPALDVLHKLNFAIRPFGPGCHPGTKEGCEWWTTRYKL